MLSEPAGAVDGADDAIVDGPIVGVDVPAGVLQPTTAPPSEEAGARAMRIHWIVCRGSTVVQSAAGSGA